MGVDEVAEGRRGAALARARQAGREAGRDVGDDPVALVPLSVREALLQLRCRLLVERDHLFRGQSALRVDVDAHRRLSASAVAHARKAVPTKQRL